MDCDREDVEGKQSEIVEENRSRLNGLRLVEPRKKKKVFFFNFLIFFT